MKRVLMGIALTAVLMAPGRATAATIELAECAVRADNTVGNSTIDGTPLSTTSPDLNLNDQAFVYATGLGTITLTVTGVGSHVVAAVYDFDIVDEVSGNTYFDDSAAALGVVPTGAGWEIDEPGWTFGDIYPHFSFGSLDGTAFNDKPITKEDVAMALSWSFVLAAGETATLTFSTSLNDPGGFRLRQFDASGEEVFLSSSMRVTTAPVPEPSALLLLGGAAMVAARRVRRHTPLAR